MFNLRKEQLKIFEQVAAKDFEQRTVAHLRKHFPNQCSAMDEAGLLEITRYGIGRAKTYGIVAQHDVCKYINVMFVLGRDFDQDPRYPWAARTLGDATLGGPGARVSRLSAEALDTAAGKGTHG